jgi:hypothetical protein
MHIWKVIPKNCHFLETSQFSSLFGITFYRCILSKSKYVGNQKDILRLLIFISPCCEKIFVDPYIRQWMTPQQQWSGNVVQKNFWVIFLTFERDTTNLRGILVENVKKSKINPTYCASYTAPLLRKTVLRIRIRSDPDLFGRIRIRIRTSGTGSGSGSGSGP